MKPKILPSQEILRRASTERITVIVRGLPCKCWRCGHDDVSVALLHHGYGTGIWDIVKAEEELALAYARELLQSVHHPQAGTIKMRPSRTAGESYLSNGCLQCDALFGRFFISEDLTDVLGEDAADTLPVLARVERSAIEWYVLQQLSWTTGRLERNSSEEC